jgi:hypothetical protein
MDAVDFYTVEEAAKILKLTPTRVEHSLEAPESPERLPDLEVEV